MKTLYILRHAKSSWDNPNLADFERPLNTHGLNSAPFMGEVIYKNKFQPCSVLSSPAKRAKQTAILVKNKACLEVQIQYDERLYEASPKTLLQVISEVDVDKQSIMLVGHNPGLEGLIRLLTGENQAMSTASLAVIDLKIENWNETAADCGTLRTFIRPND
ncbi:MAG: putative phosphohistidine phosphatase, SixA [Acidobacteria bacterium]|jgi:phosphohistidine phosphatase|nr:putative phosphohistidine phosphatase, SixA [Acidobacteriota bacterium]